ncbi:MAG: hemerythrin domain-containing protein [Fidelibacterota bacterium]
MNPTDRESSHKLNKQFAALPHGHALKILAEEHIIILSYLNRLEELANSLDPYHPLSEQYDILKEMKELAQTMHDVESHHKREEEILFPEIEKRGILGPPNVMRSEHETLQLYKEGLISSANAAIEENWNEMLGKMGFYARGIARILRTHIKKENEVLYPAALKVIDDPSTWSTMKEESDKIGYCKFTPVTSI